MKWVNLTNNLTKNILSYDSLNKQLQQWQQLYLVKNSRPLKQISTFSSSPPRLVWAIIAPSNGNDMIIEQNFFILTWSSWILLHVIWAQNETGTDKMFYKLIVILTSLIMYTIPYTITYTITKNCCLVRLYLQTENWHRKVLNTANEWQGENENILCYFRAFEI